MRRTSAPELNSGTPRTGKRGAWVVPRVKISSSSRFSTQTPLLGLHLFLRLDDVCVSHLDCTRPWPFAL